MNTYELIMAAAANAGRDDVVLKQSDAARAALRKAEAVAASESNESYDESHENYGRSSSRRDGELSPAALALEVAAAGRLNQWSRVSPIMAMAMRGSSLRGSAGVRLYAALIGAAAACGKPQRGLEVFREMSEDSSAAAAEAATVTATAVTSPEASQTVSGGVGDDVRDNDGDDDGDDVVVDDDDYDDDGHDDGDDWREKLAAGIGGGRLPPPNAAAFMASLDCCLGVGGKEAVDLAIGIAKQAAATSKEFKTFPSRDGEAPGKKAMLSSGRLAAILSRAGEVCSASGSVTTGKALEARSLIISGNGQSS